VALATNGTRAVLIDSAQNFGLQIATSTWESGASAYQQNIGGAGGTSGNSFNMWGRSDSLRMWTNAYFDGGTYVRQVANSVVPTNFSIDSTGALFMQSAPSGTAGSTFVTGNITTFFSLKKDNTVALQGGTQSTGTGIAFPATQNPSSDPNTLDDYEEGSWTPVLTATGTAPNGVTYSNRYGQYTKIGNIVYIRGTILLSSKGAGGSGSVLISGLPFSSQGGVGYAYQSFPFYYYDSGGISGSNIATVYDASNALYISTPFNANSVIQWSIISNSEKISWNGFYQIG
jgi:hypothetical protein